MAVGADQTPSPSPLIPVGSQPSAAFGRPRKLSGARASVPAPSRAKAKEKALRKADPNTACWSCAAESPVLPWVSAGAADSADSRSCTRALCPCSAQVHFAAARQFDTPQNSLEKCSHASHCPPNLPHARRRGGGAQPGGCSRALPAGEGEGTGGVPACCPSHPHWSHGCRFARARVEPAAGSPPSRLFLHPGGKRLFSGRARSRWPEEGGRGPPAAPREFSPCAVAAFPG